MVGYGALGYRVAGDLEGCTGWSGGVVRGGPLGVIHLRYHGGIGSRIDWSFGTFSLGGYDFCSVLVGMWGAFA